MKTSYRNPEEGTTRRAALVGGAAAAALAAAGWGPAADDALDEGLGRLHAREPLARAGMSTHAPMVVEALCALGFPERVGRWLDGYRRPELEIPTRPTRRIDAARWREALGPRWDAATWEAQLVRYPDWVAFFVAALADAPWRDVLDTWVARLTPGLCSAATHGVIRTAHAASGLGRRDTRVRRAELARGLAYWAAAYQELPARPGGAHAPSLAAAIDRLPLYWEARHAAPTGNIVNGLRQVGTLDAFATARDAAPAALDLDALAATFAHVFRRHGHRHTIAFVHAVTGPCALRRLGPHLRADTARAALPYAWQAAAAIYAAYARRDDPTPPPAEKALAPAELAGRAVEHGDEHVIKLVDVLVAEHARAGDPVFLAAAGDVLGRL